ncbi:MAG: hypothetical protein WDN08_15415 [Rhizomicrobium sp.]
MITRPHSALAGVFVALFVLFADGEHGDIVAPVRSVATVSQEACGSRIFLYFFGMTRMRCEILTARQRSWIRTVCTPQVMNVHTCYPEIDAVQYLRFLENWATWVVFETYDLWVAPEPTRS